MHDRARIAATAVCGWTSSGCPITVRRRGPTRLRRAAYIWTSGCPTSARRSGWCSAWAPSWPSSSLAATGSGCFSTRSATPSASPPRTPPPFPRHRTDPPAVRRARRRSDGPGGRRWPRTTVWRAAACSYAGTGDGRRHRWRRLLQYCRGLLVVLVDGRDGRGEFREVRGGHGRRFREPRGCSYARALAAIADTDDDGSCSTSGGLLGALVDGRDGRVSFEGCAVAANAGFASRGMLVRAGLRIRRNRWLASGRPGPPRAMSAAAGSAAGPLAGARNGGCGRG
jgi:hypothetical protein